VSRWPTAAPGGQLCWHVDDPLAAGDELIGQQIAEPAGAFDRPHPPAERPAHPEQPRNRVSAEFTRRAPNRCSPSSSAIAVSEPSRRSTPIIHCHRLLHVVGGTEIGMSDSRSFGAHASLEPHPGDTLTVAPRSEARPRRPADGYWARRHNVSTVRTTRHALVDTQSSPYIIRQVGPTVPGVAPSHRTP
jgi:hypothetical protein